MMRPIRTNGTKRWPISLCTLALLVGSMGCEQPEPDTAITLEQMAANGDYTALEAGDVSIRRLTQNQFINSIADIFGEDVVVPRLTEPDTVSGGLISVGASTTSYSPRGVESLEDAAFAIATQATDTDILQARLLPCEPTGTIDAECSAQSLDIIGKLAWRRPLDDDELTRITDIATNAAEIMDSFYVGLEFGIAGLLQSPNFLFRIETGEPDPNDASKYVFNDFELASRLSFFLWNTTPDLELLESAAAGELSTRDGLFAQASRMLESPRARVGLSNFFSDRLKLYELDHLSKDPTLFEHYNTQLGDDAAEETLRLSERIVFDDESDYRDIMTTRETFVNPRLAALYNIPAPAEKDFGHVELDPADGRVGLLGHASFLNQHAHAVSSSATLRGKAVRKILLCQAIPVPPVDVDTSIPEPSGDTLTLRDRVAEHLTNPACAGCHQLTDPIGLGLENFDAIGRWRDTDHGKLIDASGELDSIEFGDAAELGEAIRNHPAFVPCIVKTLGRYATGRLETDDEIKWLDVLVERFSQHEYRIKPLVLELIMSPMFRSAGNPAALEEDAS